MIRLEHKFALHIKKLRCTCIAHFVKIHPAVFEIPRADFLPKIKKLLSNEQKFQKKSKNILAILFLDILHMANFKKLALIATEI